MFIDEASIHVIAGDGGNGCASFRREKYVPRGGPNGGDGGKGGDVVLVADPGVPTLLELRYRPQLKAQRGRHGEGSDRTGRSGSDYEVRVPVGTLIRELFGEPQSEQPGEPLVDLTQPEQRWVAARGGIGGRGNARFKTSVNQAPRRAEPGRPGEERRLLLELKLLADVGLVGFPNAGKSTLVSRVSAARPRIADYPFTTLEPCLGVVDVGDYQAFVMADLPGLIEGAHRGAGLGDRFLRHIERCRLLLHLVDPTSVEREPLQGIEKIEHELASYDPGLANRPRMLVLTKADSVQETAAVEAIQRWARAHELDCVSVSAVTGEGIDELVRLVWQRLQQLPATEGSAG